MMKYPLLIKTMVERAYKLFPKKEVFSRGLESEFRYTYADFYRRVCRLANVLENLGIKPGDTVGTFAWNNHRHLELYFAITCMGAILHPINIRLFAEHVAYIADHAGDKVIFVDEDLLPQMEEAAKKITSVEKYVIMSDKKEEDFSGSALAGIKPVYNYEKLIFEAADDYFFPMFDEYTPAAIGYTSATTGMPKGVVYSHRSTYLHALTLCVSDGIGISERDAILPVVPMFHVFSWGFPFAAAFMGSKLVLPGRDLSPQALCSLIEKEKVTLIAGVPTIWINIYQHLESGAKYDLSSLRYILNGGAPISPTLVKNLDKKYGLKVLATCGMTEASPVVLTCPLKSYMDDWDEEKRYAQMAKQGRLLPGLEARVVNEKGEEVRWDGKEMGELLLRGPWVACEYYKDPERSAETFKDGWYYTGDIVTIDEEGYMLVQDRSKDLIKSGGEWISSVDLENKIMAHPDVVEACVIAMPHEKWQERPLACVVLKKEARGKVKEEDIIEFLKDKVVKWWLPDKVIFIEEVPKTSVGKFDKKRLREIYGSASI